MGQRRMFSNRIANSAKFLQMPTESQLLYFHMILRADDDGVVESYPLMKLLGTAPDNLKVLLSKGFIHQLNEDQVVVIIDWHEHNVIRADRKVDSIYIELLRNNCPQIPYIAPKPRIDVQDNSKRLNGQSTDGISQVKLSQVKSSQVKIRYIIPPDYSMVSEYITNNSFDITPDEFIDCYESRGWKVGKSKMIDWQASLRTFARNKIKWSKDDPKKQSLKEKAESLDYLFEKKSIYPEL